ncbi:MAG: polyprenyl synthetase family protein [Verrucomicrobiota bacterium]
MSSCLHNTRLSKFFPAKNNIVGNGKMLRARLTLEIGRATGIDERALINAAATVEIIHGASLLHDDVIDGGILRRGAPTFWKKHGINGAILLGDMLVFNGLKLLIEVDRTDLLKEMINMSAHVCRSEVEQELVLRGSPGIWEECEEIARTKTGSLFAFAAVAGGTDAPGQTEALREAGFILGTAYQLADDVLDASGNEVVSGKTLGKDAERGKTTAITATKNAPDDPIGYIHALLEASSAQLAPWPELQEAWNSFLEETIRPILEKFLTAGEPA